ncbi:hypothetical protein B0E55_05250 [Rhodococcus sp. 66b]|nr:hypothetical protein B0E55_05250 [Rhodococcus sp. 66b]
MSSETHVQQCAALICAYITNDDEACEPLRDATDVTYWRWYESATILCAIVLNLIAFNLGSRRFTVIDRSAPERQESFPVADIYRTRRRPRKRALTLAIRPRRHFHRVFEPGCSIRLSSKPSPAQMRPSPSVAADDEGSIHRQDRENFCALLTAGREGTQHDLRRVGTLTSPTWFPKHAHRAR